MEHGNPERRGSFAIARSNVGGSAEVLGRVTLEAAGLTGLPVGTPVVGGGADNACGAAGVGVITPGEAVTSWGTSGTVLAPTRQTTRRSAIARAHVLSRRAQHVVHHGRRAVRGRSVRLVPRPTRTRSRRTGEANERLNAEAAAIPAGAEGVTFLPYLQGERTPHRDASARGAFMGLSLAHSRAHLARAVVEGCASRSAIPSRSSTSLGWRRPICCSRAAEPRARSCVVSRRRFLACRLHGQPRGGAGVWRGASRRGGGGCVSGCRRRGQSHADARAAHAPARTRVDEPYAIQGAYRRRSS